MGPTPKSEEEVLANRLENGFSNNIIPNSLSKHQKLFPKVVKSTTTKSEKHFKPKINSKISEKKITRIAYGKYLLTYKSNINYFVVTCFIDGVSLTKNMSKRLWTETRQVGA